MRFGLFSNGRRPKRDLAAAWEEDIREMVVADGLGFDEIWISEHEIPAELIICKAAPQTKRVKLGSAVRPLGYYHPFQIVTEANGCDLLTGGRYMLGVGTGFTPSKMKWRGRDPKDAREMMFESLKTILALWDSPDPVDLNGKFWTGYQMKTQVAPVQRPRPPIGISVASSPETAEMAGRLGLIMLTSDFASPQKLRGLNEARMQGAASAGHPADCSKMRVCRVIYVGEDDRSARDDMRRSYEDVIAWEIKNTPQHQVERIPAGGSLEDITFDYLVDTGNLIIGGPETVRQQIEELYHAVGGFGLLLFHAGRDYATPEKVEQSLRRFDKYVAPKLQHLKIDASIAA